MTFDEQLRAIFGERVKMGEPMAKHTNFRIGGPAKWYTEVKTADELTQAIAAANTAAVKWFVLGGGSNTLVADEGIDGLVLQLAMRDVKIDGTTVVAGAGAISVAVARQTADAGLAGFTWAISLPGTIGGAARGNAGCFGGEMKDVVKGVKVLRGLDVIEVSAEDLKYGYRESSIKHSTDVILEVMMQLQLGDKVALKASLEETLSKRKASQPLYAGSAGCMFKNYEVKDDAELAHLKSLLRLPEGMEQSKRIGVGWLVEQLDLKGTKIGGAQISPEHGNFIINSGDATASDILQVISLVKTRARNQFGIQLQEEVQLMGF